MRPTRVHVLEDHSAQTPSDQGFLKVRRLRIRVSYPDGSESPPLRYDVVDRDALDAVAMVLYDRSTPDEVRVCLRTALRPPLATRAGRALAEPEEHREPVLWEIPAGLIETENGVSAGVAETASKETREETGYLVDGDAFSSLGHGVFLTPGLCAEKVYFVSAEVRACADAMASSEEAIEHGARIEWVGLDDALARIDRGEIEDAKTEIALRRFAARAAARSEQTA